MKNYTVDWKELRAYCSEIMEALGVPRDEAFTIADVLVDADLSGVGSHGVSRMTIYTKRLEEGVVNKDSHIVFEREYPAGARVNGGNAMGMVVGKLAMERCIEKAGENASCFITVNNSNHYGMASYYVRMAAEAGMIGFSSTNAPPNIAPWGSSEGYHGTNPIAISAPTLDEPVILDMAPSVVAMGKIILAAKLGKSIPEGWALTKEGKPTTNAKEGMEGTVVPIGGPKGYGLAFFVDVLCGILSGAAYGPHLNNMWHDFKNPQKVGHVFGAIDISKFMDPETFKATLSQMISEIKALPKNEGITELFVPGEIEQRRKEKLKEEGIVLSQVVYDELLTLGDKYGVAVPW